MDEVKPGWLLVVNDPVQITWSFFEKNDIVLILHVQPLETAPTPWLREVIFICNGKKRETTLTRLSRSIRAGEVGILQIPSGYDTIEPGNMDNK